MSDPSPSSAAATDASTRKTPTAQQRFQQLLGGLSPAARRSLGQEERVGLTGLWDRFRLADEPADQVERAQAAAQKQEQPYGYLRFDTTTAPQVFTFATLEEMLARLRRHVATEDEVYLVPFVGTVLPLQLEPGRVLYVDDLSPDYVWECRGNHPPQRRPRTDCPARTGLQFLVTDPAVDGAVPILPRPPRRRRRRPADES